MDNSIAITGQNAQIISHLPLSFLSYLIVMFIIAAATEMMTKAHITLP